MEDQITSIASGVQDLRLYCAAIIGMLAGRWLVTSLLGAWRR